MRFILNNLTTILTNFGIREVTPNSDTTHLNVSSHHNPRTTARSRSARLQAAKSATRLHKHRSTANGTTNSSQHNPTTGNGAAHRTKPRGTKYRQMKSRRLAGGKPLRRCNTALIPQPVHPQPPGAFNAQQSFVVPRYPRMDDRHLPPFAAQNIFVKAKQDGDQVFFRAQEEREEHKMEAERARQLEQEREARRREADAEYLRRLEEDSRRAVAVHHRAMQEEFARGQAERIQKVLEACLRAQEERQRQAEREAMEFARREQERIERERRERERMEREHRERERMERERREQERMEREHREREAAQPDHATQLRLYEEKWAQLRGDSVGAGPLTLNDIPWPWFGFVPSLEEITDKRVLEFVGHPLRRHLQSPDGGKARTLRLELLRWHSDRFDGKVLARVVDDDRETVKDIAGRITRILTDALS